MIDLEALDAQHLRRRLPPAAERPGPVVGEAICLSSNNYLGLATHPKVMQGAIEAIARSGCGATGSRLLSGNLSLHEELEGAIARFKGSEAALLFNSGYAANLGVLTALAGENDLVLSDRLNHASIIDGTRACGAEVRHVPHASIPHCRRLLEKGGYRRSFLVSDGVFSMDGDLAPVPELVALAREFEATLILDEAHATGVLGATGRGTLEYYGISPLAYPGANIIQVGTLGKALGGFGAFVACDPQTRDLLINRARSFIYSTALPPAVLGAALAALTVLEDEPALRETLHANARLLRDGLRTLGFEVPDHPTPIIPVIVGDSKQTLAFAEHLQTNGVQALAVRPPTVKQPRIRLTVMATHTPEQLSRALGAFRAAREEILPCPN